jgi:hypothetical protein
VRTGARHNPFAVERLGPFGRGYTDDRVLGIEQIEAMLEACGWRGELVGPEGSGKSTLLRALHARAETRGLSPRLLRLRDTMPLPALVAGAEVLRGGFLMLDGAELIPRPLRRVIFGAAQIFGVKLIATVHTATPGVSGVRITCTEAQFAAIVADLLGRPATTEELAALPACSGDARKALFRLYDEHERRHGAVQGVA